MRREHQIREIKLLETRLDAGTTVDAGGLMKNPTSVYVDPALAEREWRGDRAERDDAGALRRPAAALLG